MKLRYGVLALCLIINAFTFSALSQSSQAKKDKKSELKPIDMKVNLMVLNSENKVVDNLKSDDLKIFEDGVEQKITYLEKKGSILNIGLVFDNSDSVRKYLDEVIIAGKTVVSNLNSDDEAFVIRFTSSDKIQIIQDWTSNKADLNEVIDNLFIESGQTAVLDAIYLSAGKLLQRAETDKLKRYGIILISDAEDRDSYYKLDDVSKLFKGTDLQIFLLSFAEGAPVQKKKALRLSNLIPLEIGGTVYSLPKKHDKDELISGLKSIITELRSNYVVGYTSTNSKRDGLP